MVKLGAITVGQSPRVDVTPDLAALLGLGEQAELIEGGGLDGLSKAEIEAFAPGPSDYVLVSRLNDGTEATFAERHVLPRIQAEINRMEKEGVRLIMMFCTGEFPDSLVSHVPLLYPSQLLDRLIPLLTKESHLIVATPSPLQKEQQKTRWGKLVDKVEVVAVSPYGSLSDIRSAAKEAAKLPGDLVLLDCIGFSQKMKDIFLEETGKPVVLPRTLLARVAAELL